MKKIIIVLMLAIISFSVFALDNLESYSVVSKNSFLPTSTRYEAMGKSGLAQASALDALFINPSALASKKFSLAVPSLTLSLYNIQPLLANATVDWENFDPQSDAISLATTMVANLGKGDNEVLSVDGNVSLGLGSFALSTAVQLKLHAYRPTVHTADQTLIPEVNLAESLGFGIKIINTDSLSLSVGAAGHFVFKAYLQAQDANKFITMLSDDNSDIVGTMLGGTPVAAGYAVPVDAGVTLGLGPKDIFKVSVAVNNINAKYNMTTYGSINGMAKNLGIEIGAGDESFTDTPFEIVNPMTVNLGLAFAPKILGLINPVISADVVDILGLAQSEINSENLLLHTNLGVELGLTPLLAVRAGLNKGDLSLGAYVGLLGINVEAAYYWREIGSNFGDKKADCLSVKFILGSDK